MKKVVVASNNMVKIEAARLACERMFPDEVFAFSGVSVPSGVSDQPMSDTETYQGALHRVVNARAAEPEADYWVAFEGGVEDAGERMEAFAWVVIQSREDVFGKARTATFELPSPMVALIRAGIEMGEAGTRILGEHSNSRQETGSVIGILTGETVTRISYYVEAATLALIPFKNSELYR